MNKRRFKQAKPIIGYKAANNLLWWDGELHFMPLIRSTDPYKVNDEAKVCSRHRMNKRFDKRFGHWPNSFVECMCGFYAYSNKEAVRNSPLYLGQEMHLTCSYSGIVVECANGLRATHQVVRQVELPPCRLHNEAISAVALMSSPKTSHISTLCPTCENRGLAPTFWGLEFRVTSLEEFTRLANVSITAMPPKGVYQPWRSC